MQRDTQEALDRFEKELLAEEQPQEDYDDCLEAADGEDPVVFQNFANRYGRDLRNHATGYKAYNADRLDTDLEEFSRQVREGKKKSGLWLPILTVTLLTLGVLYILYLYLGGIL